MSVMARIIAKEASRWRIYRAELVEPILETGIEDVVDVRGNRSRKPFQRANPNKRPWVRDFEAGNFGLMLAWVTDAEVAQGHCLTCEDQDIEDAAFHEIGQRPPDTRLAIVAYHLPQWVAAHAKPAPPLEEVPPYDEEGQLDAAVAEGMPDLPVAQVVE